MEKGNLVKRISVFSQSPSLAEQVFCPCQPNDLSEHCQKVIQTVEQLATVVSNETYDPLDGQDLRSQLARLGVTEEQIHRFFAARFVVGRSINPEQKLDIELLVLHRVGIPQHRISQLMRTGQQVAEFCKDHGVAADHVVITKIMQGRAPASLVFPF